MGKGWQRKAGGVLRRAAVFMRPSNPCASPGTHSPPPPPQNRHCLLDIAPHAIERLHHMHIYPVVIFIHYKSAKHIK